ncbi:hypothetical protein [Desulfosporosinus sp.]|nr:hypothetical protein [Desulfosporosinus sp.]MBC2722945.1 hypothetical protein [Desulfosporosinus sp.]MBC2727598.1 hypothetical protein [Desulfosporosinus sp.]
MNNDEEQSFNGYTINGYGTGISGGCKRYYNWQQYNEYVAKDYVRTGLYG